MSDSKKKWWQRLAQEIQQPIGLVALPVLTLPIMTHLVLSTPRLPPDKVWSAFCWVNVVHGVFFLLAAVLVIWKPANLVLSQQTQIATKAMDEASRLARLRMRVSGDAIRDSASVLRDVEELSNRLDLLFKELSSRKLEEGDPGVENRSEQTRDAVVDQDARRSQDAERTRS